VQKTAVSHFRSNFASYTKIYECKCVSARKLNVFISKEENQRLDKGGFKSKRFNLNNAFIAYEKMGISIKEFNFGQK